MKNALLIIIVILSLLSCDDNKSETDADVITDIDTAKDEDASAPDEDQPPDEDIDIQSDSDTEEPDTDDICAKVIDYSLLPFKDDKGNLHFCREGCDTPTSNNPQCLSNLWKEDNEELCTKYPQLDCCGYPCDMDNLIPTYEGEGTNYLSLTNQTCDMALNANNPNGWETAIYTMKSFNFQEGKIGFTMAHVGPETDWHVNQSKAFEYDVKTKKYSVKSITSSDMLAYNNGKFLTYVTIKDTVKRILTYYSNGTYTFVYPNTIRNIAYTPALTDKWAFANIREKDDESVYMKYAAVKEHDGSASYENIAWSWISLGEGVANDPNIVDDRLVFYGDGFKGYICELDKEPKSLDECKLINRTIGETMEEIRQSWVDTENKNLIYFSPVDMTDGFMRLDTSTGEYKKFSVTKTYEDTNALAVMFAKGNLISYINIVWEDGDSDNQRNIACFYRIDEEKSYCPELEDRISGSWTELYGHYIAWQLPGNPELHLRDMECYCDLHPEVCPYDDYTPNHECPKNIKTGEHECGSN